MEKRSGNLIKNTAVLTFGSLCTKGIMFIMTPLFTRWLSQADYGTFDLLINYVTLIVPIVTLDIGEAVFRFLIDVDKKRQGDLLTNALVANLFGMVFSLIVGGVIMLIFPSQRDLILCFVLVLLAETIFTFFSMIMRGLRHLTSYTIAHILNIVVMVILAIVLVKALGLGIHGLFASYALGYFAGAVFMGVSCKIHRYIHFSSLNKGTMKEMLSYSVHMIPNAVSWWLMNISDRTIVTIFLGSGSSAILSVSHKVPSLCQTLFSRFHLSWQQSASETINDNDRDKFFSSVLNGLLQIMCALVALLMSVNYFYFKWLYTDEYFQGFYIMPILLAAILVYMICQFMGGIYIADYNSKRNGITTSIAAGVNLALDLILIHFIGLYAAAISTFVAYGVLFLIRYWDIRKKVKLKLTKKTVFALIGVVYFMVGSYSTFLPWIIFNICLCVVFCIGVNFSYLKSMAVSGIAKIKGRGKK